MIHPVIPVAPEPAIPPDATPVMAQFFAAKASQPDALLFFRMGDFYELFFEDAVRASELLGVAPRWPSASPGWSSRSSRWKVW